LLNNSKKIVIKNHFFFFFFNSFFFSNGLDINLSPSQFFTYINYVYSYYFICYLLCIFINYIFFIFYFDYGPGISSTLIDKCLVNVYLRAVIIVYPKSDMVESNGLVIKNVFVVLFILLSLYWNNNPFLANAELNRYFFIFINYYFYLSNKENEHEFFNLLFYLVLE
jgi:hypothetical protein